MTRRSIVRARARALMLTGLAFATVAPAFAQETITYTYDNKGRLITVNHNGGPSNGVNASYTYDNADNRTNVAVTGAGTTTITLAPTSLPGGTVNSAYSQTITASGGSSPYTFSYTGTLPTGLSLSSSGILSGTPTSTGTYSFTVTATDSASHTGSRAYSVTIAAAQTCVGVSFAVANVSANEGSNLSFTVTKSGATSNTCTVNYATANGTAVSGTNYTANSGTLSFASSTTSQAVTVATIDDHVVTGALTMDLNLSSPSGSATISDNQGVGTINNIDTSGGGSTTIQLTSGTSENLRTIANSQGYTGSSGANYTFVVGSGVTVTGSTGSGTGIDTGSWPAGVTLSLQINGTVRGGGGNGGNGGGYTTGGPTAGSPGGAGGDAVRCSAPITIAVNSGGTVQAGGGGGGGGGDVGYSSPSGGGIIGGGGGGGGAPNGSGGVGGSGWNGGASGGNGAAGSTSGGGAGATGSGPPGGSGGAYGAVGIPGGSAGGQGTLYGTGGAAGYAVRKNGTGCTASGAGTITGTVG